MANSGWRSEKIKKAWINNKMIIMNANQCLTQQTNIFINISADYKTLIFELLCGAQRLCDH